MQLSYPKTSALGNGEVSFPGLECWNNLTQVATVAATVNKKRVLCRISLSILKDKFGASEKEPMRSVVQQRRAIQEAARKLIESDAYEEDGSILIRAHDL